MLEPRLVGVEEDFRSSIQDVVAIGEKLASYCKTTEDLVTIAKLALEHDAQLRLLINLISTPASKR